MASPTASVTTTAAGDDAAEQAARRAGQGLSTVLSANPLPKARTNLSLRACPLGSLDTLLGKLTDVVAKPDGRSRSRVLVQRYAALGDRGLSIGCTRRAGSSIVLVVGAATHAKPVSRSALPGFSGPVTYRSGGLYLRIQKPSLCSVYWVPPVTGYVLTITFRAAAAPTPAICRRGFTEVGPDLISTLVKKG